MRIALTGATGFIGSALAEALRTRGDEIVEIGRADAARPGVARLDLAAGTIDCSGLPSGTLGPLDAAVHLAGAPIFAPWTSKRREAVRSSRIAVGDLVARTLAILDPKPAVYVTGSAVGYYGDTGEVEVSEGSAAGAGFLSDLCRAWETSATPAAEAGIRVAALRTGIVLGPGGGSLAPQLPLFRLGLGPRLGNGRQWTSWISLRDEVKAILRVLDDPTISGPVNLTSPNPVRNAEMTDALASALGRRARLSVPAPVLRVMAGRQLADEMLLVSQKVRPSVLEEAGFEWEHPTVAEAFAATVSGR